MSTRHAISYAQNREDIIIDAFFDGKSDGFYIDVGANHPVRDSVTKLFYIKGWHGINFEPNASLLQLLQADRPQDINIGKGISNKVEKKVFREYVDSNGLSTFSPATIQEEGTNKFFDTLKQNYVDNELELSTLAIELKKHQVQAIDFIKIDVEGLEYEVIEGNDWTKYRPELVCIEANHINKDWRPLLKKAGYTKFFNDGLNDYYAANESPRLKSFSYPEKVLMRYPFIDYFTPHADSTPVDNETFLTTKATEEAPEIIPPKLKVLWSLVGLRDALSAGIVEAIVNRKRVILMNRTLEAVQGNKSFAGLTKSMIDLRLVAYRIIGVGIAVSIKVMSGVVRVVR